MTMKLVYTTPEAEVVVIRPNYSVLQTSGGSSGEPMPEDPGSWGDN
jgi:hypothetical protein